MPTISEQALQVREIIGQTVVNEFWGKPVNQYEFQDLLRGKIPAMAPDALTQFIGGHFSRDYNPGEESEALRFLDGKWRGDLPPETREFLIQPNGEVLRAVYDAEPVGSNLQRMPHLTGVADCLVACDELHCPRAIRDFPREPVAYIREVLAQFLEGLGKDKYWYGPVAAVSLLRGEPVGEDHRPLEDTSIWTGLSYHDPIDPDHLPRYLEVKGEHGIPIGESGSQGLTLVVSRRDQDTTRFCITPEGILLDLVRSLEPLEVSAVRLERDLEFLKRIR